MEIFGLLEKWSLRGGSHLQEVFVTRCWTVPVVYIVHVPGNNEVILFQHSTSNINQFVQDKGTQGLSADERAKVWNLFFFVCNYVFYTIYLF